MKPVYLFILTVLSSIFLVHGVAGCAPPRAVDRNEPEVKVSANIYRVKDGEVTCYLYSQYGISCVRTGE